MEGQPAIHPDGPAAVVLGVLGAFTATVDRRPLARGDWGRLSAERLVKLLAITTDHRLSREVAAETLWPEFSPDAGRANLRKAMHFARRAIGAAALPADATHVWLDRSCVSVDLDRLTSVLAAPGAMQRTGSVSTDADARELLELGGRELLPDDLYEEWLVGPRERLRVAWRDMALRQAAAARHTGGADEAHILIDRVLERDPADEEAHRLAIELYLGEGRHHAARRQLELCRSILASELGVEPAPETVALLRSSERASADAGAATPAAPPLIGRHAELDRIEAVLDRLSAGEHASLLLRGPAGIGKSRLMAEVIAYGRASGWRVAQLQPVETVPTDAFGPLAGALAAAVEADEVEGWAEPARSGLRVIAPSLGAPYLAFQSSAALGRAVLAGIVAAAGRAPLMLAVEDLPWLDSPTLDLLTLLVASAPHAPVLVVATCRDDEPIPEAAARAVEVLSRPPGVAIALGSLGRRDIEPLILGAFGGRVVAESTSRVLFERTGGNPLFCLETARAARDRGGLRLDEGRWVLAPGDHLEDVPESARLLAARRTAALPADARALLDVVAELGPTASFEVLAAARPVADDRLVPAIDSALASGMLVEHGDGYALAHPLYRAALRRAAGVARRGAIHLSIARALAGHASAAGSAPPAADAAVLRDPAWLREAAAASADPGLAADHAAQAAALGRRDVDAIAVVFGLAAGRRAMAVHNAAEAERHLVQAIAAWRRIPDADPSSWDIVSALVDLGRILARRSSWDAATGAFREAVSRARTVPEIADSYYDFADAVPYRRGDFEGTITLIEEGLARLPVDAGPARSRLLASVGWCLTRMRRIDEALPIAREAYDALGDDPCPQWEIRVLDTLAMTLHYAQLEPERQLALLERALAVAVSSGNSTWEAVTAVHLGTLHVRSGRPALARPRCERGMELAHLIGDAYLEAIAAWALAEIAEELGDLHAAVSAREREVVLLASTGGNRHNEALARAHLAHLHRLLGDADTALAEAELARRCAAESAQPGYVEHIERAIACARWSDLVA